MKRFISAVAVSIIVICALAFKTKTFGGVYCASPTPSSLGGFCNIITVVRECSPGTTYYKFPNWNGQASTCTGNVCNTMTTLCTQPH